MTGFVEARRQLVEWAQPYLTTTGIPVYWENRGSPQLDQVKPMFIHVDIDFTGGALETMDGASDHSGLMVFDIFTREGEGVVKELEIVEILITGVANRSTGELATGAMDPGIKTVRNGWRKTEWFIPFRFIRM